MAELEAQGEVGDSFLKSDLFLKYWIKLYMTTYIFAHKIRLSKRLSCRLVRHPSWKKDSRQAGMTQYAQKLMTLCINNT
jgi:hypothetical protein